jgi:cytochrome c-type biogenesis protein CcmH/NrfG
MTTGTTAVGGDTPQVLPRRLALVVLVAITTFAVARFVTFDPPSTASRPTTAPSVTTPEQKIAALEASTRRDPENATTWQQLGASYLRH